VVSGGRLAALDQDAIVRELAATGRALLG